MRVSHSSGSSLNPLTFGDAVARMWRVTSELRSCLLVDVDLDWSFDSAKVACSALFVVQSVAGELT